jgi:hypothetical protein
MAEVLTLQLTGRHGLHWRSAACDSSGMAGFSIDERFTSFAHFAQRVEGPQAFRDAHDHWMLVPIKPRYALEPHDIQMVIHTSVLIWTGPKLQTQQQVVALRKRLKTLPAMAAGLAGR